MKIIGVIPARYSSKRFPGKPLAKIKGKYLIQRVFEQVKKCKALDKVIIATDDKRIAKAAENFGACAVMTSKSCKSGTDRIAEIARKLKNNSDIIINIQGDEPLISPSLIDDLARVLVKNPKINMATAAYPLKDVSQIKNSNINKVVFDKNNYALYFSHFSLPYNRDNTKVNYFKHIGIYAYRRGFILKFASWKQTPLEKAENLEQLRALENGEKIKVVISKNDSFGVDTPKDAREIEKMLRNKNA